MVDELTFEVPWGPVGRLAAGLVVGPHLRRFLEKRGGALKGTAESRRWRECIPGASDEQS